MAYSYRLFNSIADVDRDSWERVRSACGRPFFMDPRLIVAAEIGMGQTCEFWHVIVDADDGPVACTCFTAIKLDAADFADRRLAALMRRLPGVFSRLRNLKMLMCGLPVSAGQHNLMLVPGAAGAEIIPLLDQVACRLASEQRVQGIVYKEFAQNDLEWTRPLLSLGYRRISSMPMNFFKPSFADLQHYCAALKSRYRQQVKRSLRKRAQAGIEVSVLTDARDILRAYTPALHDWYSQVVDRAEVKLEKLTLEFFHEFARQFDGELDLITLTKDGRIVAFGWSLNTGSSYHLLFDGFDHDFNPEADVYFNLMYAGLDCALRSHAEKIHVGQAADAFKARVGCHTEPLYMFAKGHGAVMSRIFRYGSGLLSPPIPTVPQFNVFRNDVEENFERSGLAQDGNRSIAKVA
jgi:predicted N-acyltransferase